MGGSHHQSENGPCVDSAQARVEIYTTRHCGYCTRAARLLQTKGVAFTEHVLDGDDEGHRRMMERAGGRRSFPQIFINDRPIGGFVELYHLDLAGQLDILLGRNAKGGEGD